MNLFAALLVCIVISACGARATTLPSPVPSPTNNRAPTQSAVTRIVMTATPLPQTASPTRTLRPSSTPTIQSNRDPRRDAASTQRALDHDVEQTRVASFPATCENNNGEYHSISPGGKWLARVCGARGGGAVDEALEIVSKEGKHYVLYYKDYVHPEDLRDGNPPMGRLIPDRWVNDEFLYFSSNLHVSGGGTCFYGFGANGLYRMDLNSGVVSSVLILRSGPYAYYYAISPNGQKLVYKMGGQVTIFDMKSGEKVPLDFGEGTAGTFAWSPDSKKLSYATCKEKENIYEIEKSNVQIYDLETGKTDVIIEIPEHLLGIEYWDEEGLLKIFDFDYVHSEVVYWYFDWNAGQFSQPTLEANP